MPVFTNRGVLRFIYFLGVIRWYNLLLLALSQYILSAYIHLLAMPNRKLAFWFFLTDTTVHGMVLATIFSVASIFIINAFYDKEKDWINKPGLALMSQAVGTAQLANLYIVFNTIGLLFAVLASVKSLIFFLGFQFFGWFYSHKLQKIPMVRELSSGILTLAPLLAIWIHFSLPQLGLVPFFTGLLTLIVVKDVMKDVSGHRGNMIFGYHTVVEVTGLGKIKRITLAFVVLAILIHAFAVLFQGNVENHSLTDMKWITAIGLWLTGLNAAIWLFSNPDSVQKWIIRIQKLLVVLLVSGLLMIIIYRYILFFLYDKVVP